MLQRETVFMFSGQGSQYFQMGRFLYEGDAVFRQSMQRLDQVALEKTGQSIVKYLYSQDRGKSDIFDDISFSHPAIFMVEYSLAQSLIAAGIHPDVTLGASLGSFAAAAVSGLVEPEESLAAVLRQAATFEAWCEPGGMISILAKPSLFEEDFLKANSELAGINLDGHFTISAQQGFLSVIESELTRRNVPFQRLPVKFAFHSRWIDAARAPFETFLTTLGRGSGRLPMMCCDRVENLSTLPDGYFWYIARNPIRFREAIAVLEQAGPRRYFDVGPVGTLATFVKCDIAAGSDSTVHTTLTPFQDRLEIADLRAAMLEQVAR